MARRIIFLVCICFRFQLSDVTEVKGQIRLRFINVTGKKITVTRNFQAVQKKKGGTPEYKQLESNVQMVLDRHSLSRQGDSWRCTHAREQAASCIKRFYTGAMCFALPSNCILEFACRSIHFLCRARETLQAIVARTWMHSSPP